MVRGRQDEEVDQVLAVAVHESRHRTVVEVVQAAADEGESLRGEVEH